VTGYTNKVGMVDLKTSGPLQIIEVSHHYISPPARKDHKLHAINDKLYMFGGQGKYSK
jgi:hypothetical protein